MDPSVASKKLIGGGLAAAGDPSVRLRISTSGQPSTPSKPRDQSASPTPKPPPNHHPQLTQQTSIKMVPPFPIPFLNKTPLTYPVPGAQLRKSPIHALPLPRSPSRRPRDNRRRPLAPPARHHRARQHPVLRKVARPGPQGNLAQGVSHPGPCFVRLPDPGFERRDQ